MTDAQEPSTSPTDAGAPTPASSPSLSTGSHLESSAGHGVAPAVSPSYLAAPADGLTANVTPMLVNGRYEVRNKLRDTALGADYLANDTQLDRLVVFKALSPALTADRGFIERFRAQAQSAANLTHPGLAAVYDWGRDPSGTPELPGPLYYLIAERVPGRTLSELVGSNGAMPVDRMLHVLVGVTSALGYAHRADVLHGGLNPDTVIVSATGVVKVADLGLNLALAPSWQPGDKPAGINPAATSGANSEADNHAAADIALWRTPEQFRGEPADARTDVYQLGLIAYFMATGRPAFTGDSVGQIAQRHREVIPPAPSKINSAVPKQMEGIIGRSLAKKSEERYPTINDQRAAFVRFRESRAGAPTVTPATAPGSLLGAIGVAAPQNSVVTPLLASGAAAAGTASTSASTDPYDDATSIIGTAGPSSTAGPGAVVSRSAGSGPETSGMVDVNTTPATRGTRIDSRRSSANLLADDATQIRTNGSNRSTGAIAVTDDTDLGEPTGNFAALDQPRKKPGPMIALIAVLMAILGVLLYFLSQQLGLFGAANSSIDVPNVIGKSSAEAQSAIAAAGLTPDTENLPDAKTANDMVFGQFPEPPAKIPKGAKVTIRVSTGAANPIVPNVVGGTADEARAKLAQRGFAIELIEKEDPLAQPGTVISQEPQAELEEGAAPGTVVKVTVAIISGTVDMPDMANKPAEDAKLELTKAQFRTTVQTEASQTVPKGQVIRTEPPAGAKVERGAPVVIFRSGGNGVIIPQLRGKLEADAIAIAASEAPGVKVDVTTRPVVDPTEVGTVVAQSPAAGTEVDPGSTLSIRIGKLDDLPTTTLAAAAATAVTTVAPVTTAAPTSATGAGVISTAKATALPATVPATAAATPAPTAAPTATPTAAPTSPPPSTVQAVIRITTSIETPAVTQPGAVPAGGAAVTAVP
jgi:eukaryotic-like serine/threonine-protein kinase